MLHFGNTWVHPEYGARCLETPPAPSPLKQTQTGTQDLTAAVPASSWHGHPTPLGHGCCAVQGCSSSPRVRNLNTFQATHHPQRGLGEAGEILKSTAHCPEGIRARKKEREDPAFRATAPRLASGPWAEMPHVPSAAWPQRVAGTEAKPQNKAEFRRCVYEGAGRGDSTGNTPPPLSMGDLFSETQSAAERTHRGRLCSGRQRGHGATRTMHRVFVLPGSRRCLRDCGRSPDSA